ncbi:MAG: OmpA family protein [Candidatus Marinimicrobia bacterium]|nr:OmpA family protein [Candidatus Neomarinimicrobiota bacterium]MCF7841152.1 OmpA family protein [Candidatus Neomarinimicrobiota bacterium]MCF7901947.1 OmpA family protein [Candidatus Neomarinimicrobiota bacterium]
MKSKFKLLNQEEKKDPLNAAPNWMVTFGDMVTLILTFFVLLLSFAKVDANKFEIATSSLRGVLGALENQKIPFFRDAQKPQVYDLLNQKPGAKRVRELNQKMEAMGMQNDVSVTGTENGVTIRMGDRVLFDVGKTKILDSAKPILDILAESLENDAERILVSGHTDNIPIHTEKFPSNWELSSTRAVEVVRYLIDYNGIDPRILVAAGYGEYSPLMPNNSPENRQINRRVEFEVTWK